MGVMNEISARPQHLFVVRLWTEAANADPLHWRGSVEHVSTGKKIYFTSLGDLNDFITLHLSGPAPSLSKGKETP